MIAPIGLGWRGSEHRAYRSLSRGGIGLSPHWVSPRNPVFPANNNLHPDLWCTKGVLYPQGKIVTNSSGSLAACLTPKTIAQPSFGTPFQQVNGGGTRNQGDRCLASLDPVKTSMQIVRIGLGSKFLTCPSQYSIFGCFWPCL